MSADPALTDRSKREAAEWFAALNGTSVSTETLQAFQDWRRVPENAEAYGRVERFWRSTAPLGGDAQISEAGEAAKARGALVRARASRTRVIWGLAAVAVAAAIVGTMTMMHAIDWTGGRVYETAVGEQRSLILEDGTQIRLDTNTRLRVRYAKASRQIQLSRGQALFDVVHNADRPFQVESGDAVIRDLGTRFDVRREGGKVQVTLIKGALTVARTSRAPGIPLTAGQQVALGGASVQPHSVDVTSVTGWTTGHLVFNDLPLAAATAEVNRYGTHKIVLDAPALQDIRVTATFDTSDPAAFLTAVTQLYRLKATNRPDGTISLTQGPA